MCSVLDTTFLVAYSFGINLDDSTTPNFSDSVSQVSGLVLASTRIILFECWYFETLFILNHSLSLLSKKSNKGSHLSTIFPRRHLIHHSGVTKEKEKERDSYLWHRLLYPTPFERSLNNFRSEEDMTFDEWSDEEPSYPEEYSTRASILEKIPTSYQYYQDFLNCD